MEQDEKQNVEIVTSLEEILKEAKLGYANARDKKYGGRDTGQNNDG